jgi:hypothetical protein
LTADNSVFPYSNAKDMRVTQDLVIANKMADAVGVRFESQASHFRFSTDKEIDIAPLREALGVVCRLGDFMKYSHSKELSSW